MRRLLLILVGLLLAAAAIAPAAHATFPGRDGRIVAEFPRGSLCLPGTGLCYRFTSRLATLNPDGSGRRVLPLGPGGPLQAPSVSADGRRLVATGAANDGTVRTGSILLGSLPTPVAFPGVVDPRSVGDVRFTPTGGLVFAADGAIYTQQVPGGPVRLVIAPGADEFLVNPAMSPDGSTIAFERVRDRVGEDQTTSLWRVGTDGQAPRRLAENLRTPDWSPDGRQLVTQDGNFSLTIVDAATGAVVRTGVSGTSPVWSPSGTRIAFVPIGTIAWFATIDDDLSSDLREVARPSRRDFVVERLDWQARP